MMRVILVATAVACSFACAPPPPASARPRLGVPPLLESALTLPFSQPEAPTLPWTIAALRPYSRARDLEALLLSTRSRAYDGLVVPGRTLPRYRAWLEPLPLDLPPEVRPDLAGALMSGEGLLAVPLTLDCPLLVYRADFWRESRLPPPTSTAALREALLSLKAHGKVGPLPLGSTVPEGVLLRSLSASAEGDVQESLHRFSSVHALEFMREFHLTARLSDEVAKALSKGQCAAAFIMASDAARITFSGSLKVLPLPTSSTPIAIYDGWCAIGVPGNLWGASRPMALLSTRLQAALADGGHLPVLPAPSRQGNETDGAVAITRLVLAPGDSSAEAALEGAFSDVFGGGVEPEEALRRAEARRRETGGPS